MSEDYIDVEEGQDLKKGSEDQDVAPIENEIEQTMKAIGAVTLSLEHLNSLIKKRSFEHLEDVLKVVRPACMNIENSLPSLHDFMDNLETIGESDKSLEVRRSIERIEDELLPVVLKFLNEHLVKQG